jgi:hypothetical protein
VYKVTTTIPVKAPISAKCTMYLRDIFQVMFQERNVARQYML